VPFANHAATAFGAWLADERNTMIIGGISTIVFIGGLVLAFKWTDKARPPQSPRQARPLKVTPNISSACTPCEEAQAVRGQVREQEVFKFESRTP
jgi:hypothetical protein